MPNTDPGSLDDLASRLSRESSASLLPSHYEGESVGERLELVDAVRCGRATWVSVLRGSTGRMIAAPLVEESDGVRRARPGDGVAASLLDLLRVDCGLGRGFDLRTLQPPSVDPRRAVSRGAHTSERAMGVDQTHESVVITGDGLAAGAVVKWSVAAESTPAPTLVAHLSAAGFHDMARPWGFVTWSGSPGESPVLVASVVDFLPDATDGWTWAVTDAEGFARHSTGLEEATAEMVDLGRVVADLHLALATPTEEIPTPVVVADEREIRRWRELATSLLDDVVHLVDGDEGDRLRAHEPAMRRILDTASERNSAVAIPVHGDLHVGQVLRWAGGYAIGDFDGNPVIPADERMVPQPAARDVAGLVQAIDHVGRVVIRRLDGGDPDRAVRWIMRAQTRFLRAYRERLTTGGRPEFWDDELLLAFRVEQECREFLYAVRHLPRWRYVPDQALEALMQEHRDR